MIGGGGMPGGFDPAAMAAAMAPPPVPQADPGALAQALGAGGGGADPAAFAGMLAAADPGRGVDLDMKGFESPWGDGSLYDVDKWGDGHIPEDSAGAAAANAFNDAVPSAADTLRGLAAGAEDRSGLPGSSSFDTFSSPSRYASGLDQVQHLLGMEPPAPQAGGQSPARAESPAPSGGGRAGPLASGLGGLGGSSDWPAYGAMSYGAPGGVTVERNEMAAPPPPGQADGPAAPADSEPFAHLRGYRQRFI